MTEEDSDLRSVVCGQVGRTPRGHWQVVAVCPFGLPAVIETAPYLDDDTPFPTLYYLTCPSAVEDVSRAEAAGGVGRLRHRLRDDPKLSAALDEVDERCQGRRRELAGETPNAARVDNGAVLDRGVGGTASGDVASCLHAYTATLIAARAGALGEPLADAALREFDGLLSTGGSLWCGTARCVSLLPGPPSARAAIDVGTNSVRLLVGVVGGTSGVRTLVRRARVTRLGAGFDRTGPLDPEAVHRTTEAVVDFAKEARRLGAVTIDLVGTSASRDASDGPAFITRLGRELGMRARVAGGPEEASLSYRGATIDLPDEKIVVIDVGGGSTELVRSLALHGAPSPRTIGRTAEAGETEVQAGSALDAVSLDLGCVRGTAAWFLGDPPTPEERVTARTAARVAFAPFADRFGPPRGPAEPETGASRQREVRARLVGVAGTITTLACLILGLTAYDPVAIHLRRFSRSDLAEQVDCLAALGAEERAVLPCMQPGRAGVIVAGGEVLLGAMEALGWTEMTVSERDILDGILLEAAP